MRALVPIVVILSASASAAPLNCPAGTGYREQTLVNPPDELSLESMTYIDHECVLPDGTRHGPYERYDLGKTTPRRRGTYDHGKRTGHWIMDTGGRYEGNYVADVQDGEWKQLYASGKLEWRVTYVKGLQQGAYEDRYESGGKRLTGTMTDNQRDGTWTFYKPDGTVLRIEKWARGKLVK